MGNSFFWDNFYYRNEAPKGPSLFAEYVSGQLLRFYPEMGSERTLLVDIGAGAGRDAIYFLNRNYHVLALDSSAVGLQSIVNHAHSLKVENRFQTHLVEISGNVMSLDPRSFFRVDLFDHVIYYSRFFLHSISIEAETSLISWLSNTATHEDMFFFEFRLVMDDDYYHFGAHFRRRIDLDLLSQKLVEAGMSILSATASTEFAPYMDEYPMVARVIFRKT